MTLKNITDTFLRILIGGWDMSLEILLIVMTLDYLTGVISAFRNKTVNSSVGYKGLLQKSTIFIVIVLAAQVDRMLGTDNHVFRNCTALSFTVNDALSVMENVGKAGIKFPKFLTAALEKLQHQIEALPEQNKHSISATSDKPSDASNSESGNDSYGND